MTPKRAGGENRPTNGLRRVRGHIEKGETVYETERNNQGQLPAELDSLAGFLAELFAQEIITNQDAIS